MEYCKFTRERPTGKKGKGGQGERREGGSVQVRLREVFLIARKQEVASRRWFVVSWSLHAAAPVTQRRRQSADFAKSPLGKGDFWEVFKL
jgi:hypothetical protein